MYAKAQTSSVELPVATRLSLPPIPASGKATALTEAGMDIGITWHSDAEGAEATADEVRSHGRKAIVKQLDYTDLPSCAVGPASRSVDPAMLAK